MQVIWVHNTGDMCTFQTPRGLQEENENVGLAQIGHDPTETCPWAYWEVTAHCLGNSESGNPYWAIRKPRERDQTRTQNRNSKWLGGRLGHLERAFPVMVPHLWKALPREVWLHHFAPWGDGWRQRRPSSSAINAVTLSLTPWKVPSPLTSAGPQPAANTTDESEGLCQLFYVWGTTNSKTCSGIKMCQIASNAPKATSALECLFALHNWDEGVTPTEYFCNSPCNF